MTERTLSDVNAQLFARYASIIAAARDLPDAWMDHPRLAMSNLEWMCATGQAQAATMPEDKASRWLGFVQGCLAMRGLIDVDTERDRTRPLFHGAARARGIDPGPTRARDVPVSGS